MVGEGGERFCLQKTDEELRERCSLQCVGVCVCVSSESERENKERISGSHKLWVHKDIPPQMKWQCAHTWRWFKR